MSKKACHKANLYIVGFMGTGKSTIGRRLARPLGLEFIDSDIEIEKRARKSIESVFADEGEDYFRQLEHEFIEEGHPPYGCVVACGGGMVVQTGMVDLLKSKGVVVCLFASPRTILKRTSSNHKRPLLEVENPEEAVRVLFHKRISAYLQVGTCITTDNRTIPEVAKHVARVYKKEAAALAGKLKVQGGVQDLN